MDEEVVDDFSRPSIRPLNVVVYKKMKKLREVTTTKITFSTFKRPLTFVESFVQAPKFLICGNEALVKKVVILSKQEARDLQPAVGIGHFVATKPAMQKRKAH